MVVLISIGKSLFMSVYLLYFVIIVEFLQLTDKKPLLTDPSDATPTVGAGDPLPIYFIFQSSLY